MNEQSTDETETVLACPFCDRASVQHASRETYRCEVCNETFDEPAERERRGPSRLRGDCLASVLEEADPDEILTDGGQSTDATERGEEGAFVRSLLAESDDLNASNDLEYLLGLVGEAMKYKRDFEDDKHRAQWVVAQWCQEVGYQPDLTEYTTGQTVPRGTTPPRLDGYQQTLLEAESDD